MSPKFINWVLSFALMSSVCAVAGNDAGHGGHSVVCGTPKNMTSLEFFDLWYAKKELQLETIESNEAAKEVGKKVVMKLYEVDQSYFEPLLAS